MVSVLLWGCGGVSIQVTLFVVEAGLVGQVRLQLVSLTHDLLRPVILHRTGAQVIGQGYVVCAWFLRVARRYVVPRCGVLVVVGLRHIVRRWVFVHHLHPFGVILRGDHLEFTDGSWEVIHVDYAAVLPHSPAHRGMRGRRGHRARVAGLTAGRVGWGGRGGGGLGIEEVVECHFQVGVVLVSPATAPISQA